MSSPVGQDLEGIPITAFEHFASKVLCSVVFTWMSKKAQAFEQHLCQKYKSYL